MLILKWQATTIIMTLHRAFFEQLHRILKPPHHGNVSLNVAAPPAWCQPNVGSGSSTTPLSSPSTSMQNSQDADQSKVDAYLRVLNPANKKDFRLYTLRDLSREMDSSDKLKMAIFTQCGDEAVPLPRDMELGFYNQSGRKLWINNRLDMNDMWELVSKGEKLTLWCVGLPSPTAQSSRNMKRSSSEREKELTGESEPPKKMSKMEKRALAEDYEQKLKEKHGDKFSNFQFKFWAEMLAHDQHQSLEEPPGHAMFRRESKGGKKGQGSPADDTVIGGMLSVMNTLCSAITPNQSRQEVRRAILSPMKRAELRSTYIKQLSELRSLHESAMLSADEYEE